jgi:hypothetical protein
VAKIPMQFFILFIGAMVFGFHRVVQPPLLFQQAERSSAGSRSAPSSVAGRRESYQPRLRAARTGSGPGPGGGASPARPQLARSDQYRSRTTSAAQKEMDRRDAT